MRSWSASLISGLARITPKTVTERKAERASSGVTSLPMIFVIDREGTLRNRILGQVEFAYLEKVIDPLL